MTELKTKIISVCTYLKDNDKTNGKSLTFEQYEVWYQHASVLRKSYLLEEIDVKQFKKIIHGMDLI